MRTIKFQGKKYLLINIDGNCNEGAIATKEQYENFEPSYAHLYENGQIFRFGEIIGTVEDITFLD